MLILVMKNSEEGYKIGKKNLCKGNTSFHLFSSSSFLTKSLKMKIYQFWELTDVQLQAKIYLVLNPSFENFTPGPALKVSKFQNGFMKSSFLPKYERKIVRISALYCATLKGRNPYNFWFMFGEKRWHHKFILKFTNLYIPSQIN